VASKKQIADGLASILETLARSPKLLTQKVKALLSDLMSAASDFIKRPEPVAAPTPDQQETIDLLWHVSGGNPESFAQNAASFPDPDLEEYLRQPGALESVVAQMSEQPPAPPAESDGIPESDIESSNVFGMKFNKDTGELQVKYNGKDQKGAGPTYSYQGVSPKMYEILSKGMLPPDTSGENKYHKWTRGVTPSLGGSVNKLLIRSGSPYQKIAG